ncbi:MAG: hypothetical protein JST02_05135 [Bacteroidetes bacterium]|nr:hypothetical protein [Bacteroidota bacterium]
MRQLLLLSWTILGLFTFTAPKCNGQSIFQSFDTTISVFTNYKLRLEIYNAEKINDYDTATNAKITFSRQRDYRTSVLFSDLVFCKAPILKFQDFNNDGVKDILIFFDYDVRSNKMYHLYLLNPKSKELIRVKDFEDIKNPEFNPKKNIVESHVISGRNYYTYYRINNSNKLIDSKKVIYE